MASVAKSVASGLYGRTFGYLFGGGSTNQEAKSANSEPTDQEYICVDYLDRQCDNFVRWAINHHYTLLSRAKAKHHLQTSTNHTFEDIELLLKHLEHSGRVLVEKIGGPTASDENTVIKFVGNT